jgi:CHAT domain-containing protein
LSRLKATREEAEQIATAIKRNDVRKALDFDANRTLATSDEMAQYQYVHFATHGWLDPDHPELSGLVLSLFDKNGDAQPGFVQLQDIYSMRLNAELVVLSACKTGLAKDVRGEGLIGLTRGFMFAGSPRVVVSLWSVSDVATAELMKRFYTEMFDDGKKPAEALRLAQTSMFCDREFNNPYYWAAFTFHGEWR